MFRLYGIDGLIIDDPNALLKKIRSLISEENVSLILIEESLSKDVQDELKRIRLENPLPLILEMPDVTLEKPYIMRDYMAMLKEALGYGG